MADLNWSGLLFLLLGIGFTLFVTERLSAAGKMNPLVSRKILHIVGVGGLAISPLFIQNYYLLAGIAATFSLILFIVVKKQWLVADIYQRKSWGIALFPLSFLLLWLLFGKEAHAKVVLPMLILAFADAGAAIVGHFLGKKTYSISGDPKTLAGSIGFMVVTLLVLWLGIQVAGWFFPGLALEMALEHWSIWAVLISFFIIALLTAIMEGATSGGWDNVTVPLMAGWLLHVLPFAGSEGMYQIFFVMVGLAAMARLTVAKGWLNAGGALLAFVLGAILYIAAGWVALILLGIFFVSGSLLGKLPAPGGLQTDAKKGKPRDYMQVICNGGIPAACIIGYGFSGFNPHLLTCFAISVAICTSDTWSSEWGIWANGKVYDIIGMKKLPAGVSGGISRQGTLAGFAGALSIAMAAMLMKIEGFWWIALGGFGVMLLDSIFGSLFQIRYQVAEKAGFTVSDHIFEGQKGVVEKGFLWMTNDIVNLVSNLIMTILMIILIFLSTY